MKKLALLITLSIILLTIPILADHDTTGGSCSSDYSYCYSETDCTGSGYYWCNNYCWGSSSNPCSSDSTDSSETCSSPGSCTSETLCNDAGYFWCTTDYNCYSSFSDCESLETCGNGYCGSGVKCNKDSNPPDCTEGYTGDLSCKGNQISMKYIFTDCSARFDLTPDLKTCSNGCKRGKCL